MSGLSGFWLLKRACLGCLGGLKPVIAWLWSLAGVRLVCVRRVPLPFWAPDNLSLQCLVSARRSSRPDTRLARREHCLVVSRFYLPYLPLWAPALLTCGAWAVSAGSPDLSHGRSSRPDTRLARREHCLVVSRFYLPYLPLWAPALLTCGAWAVSAGSPDLSHGRLVLGML